MGITTTSRSPRALSPHLTCLCPWRTLYILTCRRPPPCHPPCLSGRGSDPPQPRALPLWQLFRATSCPVPARCQTQAPPCLQTPQPRAQARSPLCRLHSEEPADISPSPRSRFQEQPSPTTGLPQPESSSLRRCDSRLPTGPPARPPGPLFKFPCFFSASWHLPSVQKVSVNFLFFSFFFFFIN